MQHCGTGWSTGCGWVPMGVRRVSGWDHEERREERCHGRRGAIGLTIPNQKRAADAEGASSSWFPLDRAGQA